MRKQEKQFRELLDEYNALKSHYFPPGVMFRVIDPNDPQYPRYQQLFQFFYPQFRGKDFVSPLA